MVLTAAANVYTSDLLFWQAYATRRHDYESLSIATGGRILKVQLVCILCPGLRPAVGLHQRSAVVLASSARARAIYLSNRMPVMSLDFWISVA